MSSADTIALSLRAFVDEQALPPERKELALRAIEAFVSFDAQQDVTLLEPLAAAASSTNKAVYEVGAQLLALLALRFDAARERWRALATSRTVAARFRAMAYLDGRMPRPFLLDLVRLGLVDSSDKVRAKAVELTDELGLREMLPMLARMETEERSELVTKALAFYVPMLRDGYALTSSSADHHYVQFRVPDALVSAPLHGPCTAEAIAAVIDEERKKHMKPGGSEA